MPSADPSPADFEIHAATSKRVILCFDGTGNRFSANPGDTNIVKLFNMMDRGNPNQMHYYQPGIGTYPAEGPVNVGFFRSLWRKLEAVIDTAIATSFDAHVIAGYRFVMRYYRPGDRIYIFGFSRGAFTARFLARMISHVGLLSVGNEEMVPFAYKVYQDYEKTRGDAGKEQENTDYMNAFKRYFCRTERAAAIAAGSKISENESGVKVHFLGLFDCVSSVGTLDVPLFKKAPPLPAVRGTAEHIRHAVAIDERRVKFKAALFAQEQNEVPEDVKEVWFPGNHGDIGGGWEDVSRSVEDGVSTDNKKDYFQLSDIALKWMIDEIDDLEQDLEDRSGGYEKFAWDDQEKADFLQRFQKNQTQMISARMHDTMTFRGGSSSTFKIILWNFMEYLPIIKRWEFVKESRNSRNYKWDYITFPLNRGGCRDIPSTALFHHAVLLRMRLAATKGRPAYVPRNHVWVKTYKTPATRSAIEDVPERAELSDIAKQQQKEQAEANGTGGGEGDSLLLPHFVHAKDETIGSVAVDGKKVVVGPTKWDRIYRLQVGA